MNYAISPRQAQSKAYRISLNEEIRIGAAMTLDMLESRRIDHPLLTAYRAQILAGLSTHTHAAEWTSALLGEYGPLNHGLSLGSGLGRVEQHLIEKGVVKHIETIDLSAEVNIGQRCNHDQMATVKDDLNFIELKPCAYDFILCHGVLHHLINLEHVLGQINEALRPGGLFLVYEYVGEDRWQFTPAKMDLLMKKFPSVSFTALPRWKVHGFESVRSSELLALIRKVFENETERSVNFGGVYFPFVISTAPEADKWMSEVIRQDEALSKTPDCVPCYHMGLYRKTDRLPPLARAWSDEELESRLTRHPPVIIKAWEWFKETGFGHRLRTIKQKLA